MDVRTPMIGNEDRPKASHAAIVLCLVVLGFGVAAMLLGQANSWDLRNYHLYNGWAFCTGRTQDFAAAQLQGYFNPLLASATFLLFTHTPPWLSSFVLGALQGANVLPLFVLARRLLPGHAQRGTPWFALLAAVVGACGATQLSELGGSMGDNLVSLPLLCAFTLAFARVPLEPRRAMLAAMTAGTVAGIKLTTAPFALGLVLAMPLLAADRAWRWRVFVIGGAGAMLGFLASNGFWMWRLWQEFGNPLHPMFGGIFGGDFVPPVSLRDARWLPRTWPEWLAYPLAWAAGAPRRVSEEWFLDLRVPLAFLALPWLWWLARAAREGTGARARADAQAHTREDASTCVDSPASCARIRALVLALTVAYIAWLALFGYYRYLAPLEMLAPLLLALAFAHATPPHARRFAVLVFGVLLLFTRPPHWGRLPENGNRFLRVDLPALPQLDRATVALADGEPLAFLAPGFPAGTRFVRIGGGLLGPPLPEYGMDRAAAEHLARAEGPLYALLADANSPAAQAAFARQHLVRGNDCAAMRSNLLARDAWLCPLQRLP